MTQNESQMSADILKTSPLSPSPTIPSKGGARRGTQSETHDKNHIRIGSKTTATTASIQAQQVGPVWSINQVTVSRQLTFEPLPPLQKEG